MRLRLPLERICAQYGFRFFDREKSKSVASTAKRQRGLQRGKPGSPLPCFASFCRSKRKAPAASGANYAFAKGPAAPTGEKKFGMRGDRGARVRDYDWPRSTPLAGGNNAKIL